MANVLQRKKKIYIFAAYKFDSMNYTAVKYKTRDDAVNAVKKMMQRKREWIERTEKEFRELRNGER